MHKYFYKTKGDVKYADVVGMTGSTNTDHYGTGI